jgi:predicted transcriptional regulator
LTSSSYILDQTEIHVSKSHEHRRDQSTSYRDDRQQLRSASHLAPNQLSDLITTVHRAIGQLGQPVASEEVLVPAVSVRRSVHHDYVVCLDCGYRGKTLRRHISVRHGLTRDEYLRRWGLPSDHRLTAPAYSERRSEMAKSIGLGRKRKSAVTPAVSSKHQRPHGDADRLPQQSRWMSLMKL